MFFLCLSTDDSAYLFLMVQNVQSKNSTICFLKKKTLRVGEKNISTAKIPLMVGIEFFSLEIILLFLCVYHIILRDGKAQIGWAFCICFCHWMSDLVPVLVHFLIWKLRKEFLHWQKLWNLVWDIVNAFSLSVEYIVLSGPRSWLGILCPVTQMYVYPFCVLLEENGACFFWGWGCCCCGYQTECWGPEGLGREAVTPLSLYLPA